MKDLKMNWVLTKLKTISWKEINKIDFSQSDSDLVKETEQKDIFPGDMKKIKS